MCWSSSGGGVIVIWICYAQATQRLGETQVVVHVASPVAGALQAA
jgi:hypothetical protein